MAYLIALVVVLTLLWIFISRKEHLNSDIPTILSPWLGYWIYMSDDKLQKEVITVEYGGDNRFLKFTRSYSIRKWFPPVNPGDQPYIGAPESWVVQAPMYRVVHISPNELYLKSIDPFRAETPFHAKLLDNGTYLEILGKKYISSTKLDLAQVMLRV